MSSPKMPEPPAQSPRQVDAAVSRHRKRNRAAAGRGSTIQTSSQGALGTALTGKTLLGG